MALKSHQPFLLPEEHRHAVIRLVFYCLKIAVWAFEPLAGRYLLAA